MTHKRKAGTSLTTLKTTCPIDVLPILSLDNLLQTRNSEDLGNSQISRELSDFLCLDEMVNANSICGCTESMSGAL